MARRKKTKSYRRRRKMGAIGGDFLQKIGGVAAGAIAAQFVSKALPDTMNDKIKAAIPLAAGIFLPRVMKGTLGESLGAGMVAAGAINLAKSFNIGGVCEDQLLLPVSVGAATDDLSVIAGNDSYAMAGDDTSDDLSVIAGMDEEEM